MIKINKNSNILPKIIVTYHERGKNEKRYDFLHYGLQYHGSGRLVREFSNDYGLVDLIFPVGGGGYALLGRKYPHEIFYAVIAHRLADLLQLQGGAG